MNMSGKLWEGNHEISVIAYDDDDAASTPDSVKIFVKQARDVKVQYLCENTQTSTQEIKGKFNIVNTGNRDYSLKDIVLRYYFTKEHNSQLQFICYYTPIGSGNLIPSFGGSVTSIICSWNSKMSSCLPAVRLGKYSLL